MSYKLKRETVPKGTKATCFIWMVKSRIRGKKKDWHLFVNTMVWLCFYFLDSLLKVDFRTKSNLYISILTS